MRRLNALAHTGHGRYKTVRIWIGNQSEGGWITLPVAKGTK